jgi:hypothetical protein
MNVLLVLTAVLLAVTSAIGAAGLAARARGIRQKNPVERFKTMSRDEVLRMLDRLETSAQPPPLMGAMCYDQAAPPRVAEYTCPVCGEKTVYSDESAFYLEQTVTASRSLFAELGEASSLDMTMDESSYCSACRPDAGTQAIVLTVGWDDGTSSSSPVTPDDLRILLAFFEGRLSWTGSCDEEMPLAPMAGRIRSILGLEEREQ